MLGVAFHLRTQTNRTSEQPIEGHLGHNEVIGFVVELAKCKEIPCKQNMFDRHLTKRLICLKKVFCHLHLQHFVAKFTRFCKNTFFVTYTEHFYMDELHEQTKKQLFKDSAFFHISHTAAAATATAFIGKP